MIENKFIVIILACLICSCSMSSIQATQTAIDKDKENTNTEYTKLNNSLSRKFISYNNKPFLGFKSFNISAQDKPLPAIFSQQINIDTNIEKSFNEYINQLINLTNLNIQITNEALEWLSNKKNTQSLSYKGDIKDYLNLLTSRFGLFWEYNYLTNEIQIFHQQTKTFKLILPQSQIQNSTSISNSNSGNQSEVAYNTEKSDAFKDALNTIKAFSKDIKVNANNSYALITVTGSPDIIQKVQNYIKEFNQEAEKAIQVKISIYEVKTTSDTNYGIDWNLVYNGTHTKINWSTVGVGDILGSSNLTTATVKAGINAGMWTGSNIVASALQKYLDATYVQGFSFYSLNGQTTPINNGQTDAYVKNLAVTTLGAGAVITADNVQTSIEQATINTGFTGSVLTNVIDNKIFLRISLDISKLVNIEKIEYGDQSNPSTVQLPHTENNKIIQNIILKSGQTAVITGFSKDANKLANASIAEKKWWWLGGSQATQSAKTTLVVIVSAYNIGSTNV